MNARFLLALLLAIGAGGCSVDKIVAATSTDRIITRLGLPQRGFATDAVFPDSAPVGHPQADTCDRPGCSQAPQFCAARGYRLGTPDYDRCLISVEQNLRARGP